MFGSKDLLGIDIGSRIIKVLELKVSGSKVSVSRFVQQDIGLQEIDEKAPEEKKRILAAALKHIIDNNKFSTKNAAFSVSGSSVIVRLVKFPKMPPEDLQATLEFEAEPHIPFDIQEVYLASHIIGDIEEGEQPQMETVLVAGKKETIQNKIDIVTMAGLRPALIDIDSFAVSNSYEQLNMDSANTTLLMVNIGAALTNICLVKDGVSRVVRDLYSAGDNFTKEIRESLQIPLEKAEEFKIKYGLLGANPEKYDEEENIAPKIYAALQPLIKELNSEIQRSIDYYNSQQTEGDVQIEKIVLSGGSADLKGLPDMIKSDLGLPVEIFRPLEHTDVSKLKAPANISSPGIAVVSGLALRHSGDTTGKK